MRGRNNNNRKGPNPLTRNYESNGPDVKIRGSAQQIAEKYAALARDAQSAGDRVMAENYLQHAEHYNRIIAAAQAQMPIQHFRDNRDEFDDDLDDERDDMQPQLQTQAHEAVNGNGGGHHQPPARAAESQPAPPAFANDDSPQPIIEGTPAEVALNPESGAAAQPRERQPRERQAGSHGEGVNGNGGNAAGSAEEGHQRRRRPRRGRRSDNEQAADAAEPAASGEAPADAAASEAPAQD